MTQHLRRIPLKGSLYWQVVTMGQEEHKKGASDHGHA